MCNFFSLKNNDLYNLLEDDPYPLKKDLFNKLKKDYVSKVDGYCNYAEFETLPHHDVMENEINELLKYFDSAYDIEFNTEDDNWNNPKFRKAMENLELKFNIHLIFLNTDPLYMYLFVCEDMLKFLIELDMTNNILIIIHYIEQLIVYIEKKQIKIKLLK